MKFTLSVAFLSAAAVAAPSTPEAMDDKSFYNLKLPDFTPSGDRIVDWRFTSNSPLEKRAQCLGTGGIANGQCVRYYSNPGCADRDHIKGYKPTCAGNCYVDKFNAVKAIGDGTYSTNCELFSDTQCQNSLGSVGGKTGGGHCKNASGWSMKCYYRC